MQIFANGNELFACTISSPSKSPAETLRTKRLPKIELYESDPAVGTTQRPSTNEELPIFKVQKFLEGAKELRRY